MYTTKSTTDQLIFKWPIAVCLISGPIPITYEKFVDLQVLKMFCGEEARLFYAQLPKLDKGVKRNQKVHQDSDAVYPKPIAPKKSKTRGSGKKKCN